jgi:hypothetical protein
MIPTDNTDDTDDTEDTDNTDVTHTDNTDDTDDTDNRKSFHSKPRYWHTTHRLSVRLKRSSV